MLYADGNYVMYYECLNTKVDEFGNCDRSSEYVEVLSRRRGGNAHAKRTTKQLLRDKTCIDLDNMRTAPHARKCTEAMLKFTTRVQA